jgi:rare lipoprotein A
MKRLSPLSPALALPLLLAACAGPRVATIPPREPPQPVFVGYEETGPASWYGHPYHGRATASGEVFNMNQMTAAHRTLPHGTWLLVENRLNGRTAEVRINDRGPFVGDRVLDLSYAAARVLGAVEGGVIPVKFRVIALPGSARGGGSGVFLAQVGSFTSEHRALVVKNELARTWAGAYLQRAEVGGRTFYRVGVGTFTSRLEAERLAKRLAAAGYEVIVTEE